MPELTSGIFRDWLLPSIGYSKKLCWPSVLIKLPKLHATVVEHHPVQPHIISSTKIVEGVDVRCPRIVRHRDDERPVVVRRNLELSLIHISEPTRLLSIS